MVENIPDSIYVDALSAGSDRDYNQQIVRRHLAVTTERHAQHTARDAHGMGMRAENGHLVHGPARGAGVDAGGDPGGFPLAD